GADPAPAVRYHARLEFPRPPFARSERRRLLARDRERKAAQRFGGIPVVDALQAHDRARVGPGAAHDRGGGARDAHERPHQQQARLRPGHIEAPVQAMRPADATRLELSVRLFHCNCWRGVAAPAHSTMSTSTCEPSPVAAALTTARKAWAVRPPRPITLPS